jgi:uncharacterized protein YfaS (alpha-2-macroglobulin family)
MAGLRSSIESYVLAAVPNLESWERTSARLRTEHAAILSAIESGRAAEARVCVENLENTARVDAETGTCSWTRNSGAWWEWRNNDVETAAMCVRALQAIAPGHRLAAPAVRWLANNRAGGAWNSTRETALAVQALAEYMRANKESSPDYSVTVEVAGGHRKTFRLKGKEALLADNRLVIPASSLGNGPQAVIVTREGQGNLYYTAYARYVTLEEGIRAAGTDLKVRRRYYRLVRPANPATATGLTRDGYQRSLVKPGEMLTSGDLLEAELYIESKNAYQYLAFEDMKPAGCEPVELRSGETYAGGLCSNMELRDEKVVFFISELPQGRHRITYRLRAEVPGRFHALPVVGYAMYAPTIRCVSDEALLGVEDAPPAVAAKRRSVFVPAGSTEQVWMPPGAAVPPAPRLRFTPSGPGHNGATEG